MSVSVSDLRFYATQHMAEDDVSTVGGPINSGMRIVFTNISINDRIEAWNESVEDTGVLSIEGLDSSGNLVVENLTLNYGASDITSERMTSVWKMSYLGSRHNTSGTINVREETSLAEIAELEPKITGIRRLFYNVSSSPVGGSDKTLYDKFFLRNNSSSNALLGVKIYKYLTGLTVPVYIGVENTFNSPQQVAHRLTEPTGLSDFGYGPIQLVESLNLAAHQNQGIWLKMELPAGNAAQDSYYAIKITGKTA